jgi:hypothetical protein
MYFYAVFTYPGGIPQSVIDALLIYAKNKFSEYFIVLEYGDSEVFPHINLVYYVSDQLSKAWSGNAVRQFRQLYVGNELPKDKSRLVKNWQARTPANLVGGYLLKEVKKEILANVGFDVDACISAAKANKVIADKKKRRINIDTFADAVKEFAIFREIRTYEDFVSCIEEMIQQQYPIGSFLPKIKLLWTLYAVRFLHQNLLTVLQHQ